MRETHPDTRSLRPGIVEIWPIPLVGDTERHIRTLSRTERARLRRRRGTDADRFAIAHGTMRQVLGRYLGCAPAAVPLRARHGEAPQTPGLRLSLSHSEQLALLAVSNSTVGVDIEDLAASEDSGLTDVAELTLSPSELAALEQTSPRERGRAWLRSWTRREAVLKAKPDALTDRSISDLDVTRDTVLDLSVGDLDVGPRYVAAIASGLSEPNIVWKELAGERQ
jgi:4'-phosphopantetheinyl transferase